MSGVNEVVYIYSAMQALTATTDKRFQFWKRIHTSRCHALIKPSLLEN
jgi:hypothetical protein